MRKFLRRFKVPVGVGCRVNAGGVSGVVESVLPRHVLLRIDNGWRVTSVYVARNTIRGIYR